MALQSPGASVRHQVAWVPELLSATPVIAASLAGLWLLFLAVGHHGVATSEAVERQSAKHSPAATPSTQLVLIAVGHSRAEQVRSELAGEAALRAALDEQPRRAWLIEAGDVGEAERVAEAVRIDSNFPGREPFEAIVLH